jgi:MFS family permease
MPVLLAGSAYRRLWAARTVSQCGDVAQFTALALLVFHLTGSGLGVSGVVIAEIIPVLLLAPVAGPLVDRLPRVTVMVGADLARTLLAVVLAVWHGDVALVYAVASGLSAGAVFFNPAAGSLLPALVKPGELVAANSGIWSAAVLVQVVVAPLAGLLTTAAGYGWAFAANAVSFAISAIVLRGLRSTEAPRPVVVSTIWAQDREALALVVRDRLLRALAAAQTLAALSAGATSALLVVLAVRRLHASGAGYGLLLAAIAVGALTGPLLLAQLPARVGHPTVVFTAFGLRGLVDLVLATVTALPAALGALVCYGVGTSTGSIAFATILQSHVPDRLRGRVFSAFDLIWQSMRLASLVAGGPLADTAGIRAVYYLGGALLVAAALAGLTLLVVPGDERRDRASRSSASYGK